VKPNVKWTVLPHGDLEKLADNLYTVEGKLRMPFGETSRKMTIVRLTGDRLAIFSAIALDEPHMAKLQALGQPTLLIIPSGIHRIDAKPWKERYPQLEVIGPAGAGAKIGEVVHLDATAIDLQDPRVKLMNVPGTNRRELAMTVETAPGKKTLVVNDLIFNLPEGKGIAGLGMRLLGFHPGHPSMPKLVMRGLIADKTAVKTQLNEWAREGFERIIVSHGAPIETPREVLLELAAA